MSAIDLDGVINFRDFGGGPGADGRRIRSRRSVRHHGALGEAQRQRSRGRQLVVELAQDGGFEIGTDGRVQRRPGLAGRP